MEDLELFGGCLKLSSVIGINPLFFAPTAKELESSPGFLMSLILDRDRSNKSRIQVLNVNSVLVLVNPMFLSLLWETKWSAATMSLHFLGSR